MFVLDQSDDGPNYLSEIWPRASIRERAFDFECVIGGDGTVGFCCLEFARP